MKKSKKIINAVFISFIAIAFSLVMFTLVTSRTGLINNIHSFVIVTGSMVPTIPVNAVVYSQPETNYKIGNIIAFTRGNITVTHRIKNIEKKNNELVYQTKGDANSSPDIQLVSTSNVQGKVIFILPFVGSFILFIRTIPGFIIFIGLPILAIVIAELLNIKKEIEKEIEKKVRSKLEATN